MGTVGRVTVEKFPPHGSAQRSRRLLCKCVACSNRSGAVGDDYVVRWALAPLVTMFGMTKLNDWFDAEQLDEWKRSGLSDEESDTVALTLGAMPYEVWKGWIEVGLEMGQDDV